MILLAGVVGIILTSDESSSKKEKEEKKEPENGGKMETLVDAPIDPITLEIRMTLLLDRNKVKGYDRETAKLYILDTIFKNHKMFDVIASNLRDECLQKPKLIVPSGKLISH